MSQDPQEILDQLRLNRAALPARPSRGRWWLAAGLAAVAAGLWFGLPLKPQTPAEPAQVTATPAPANDKIILDATGYVTARRQATVSAKVTGRVKALFIEEGQEVEAGEILARLDETDARADLELAAARAAAARAELPDLELRLAQAERDVERQDTLVARKLASSQQAEDARLAVDSLKARLRLQRRQISVAERAVKVAEVALDNTVVRAPFSGVVTVKAAQPGEIVSPISAGGGFTRTGIGTIVDMDSLEIEVDVNEAHISRVSPGQPVEAVLNAYPDEKLAARVITIVPAADRSKATVKVRIALLSRDPRIVPDMGVRVGFLAMDGAAPKPPAKPAQAAPPQAP